MTYKRVLLKLSGESLAAGKGASIDIERLQMYVKEIDAAIRKGVEIAIVIGGGNIFRGLQGAASGLERVKADQMGMLATCINAQALSAALSNAAVPNVFYTAIRMEPIGRFYNKFSALEAMAAGKVAIIAGGTGNPFFTTDTAAALRAIELEAEVMFKGTRVDGIYNKDPEVYSDAKQFQEISYKDIIKMDLRVMDMTAATMCMKNKMPIYVFNMDIPGNLGKVLDGDKIGTLVI